MRAVDLTKKIVDVGELQLNGELRARWIHARDIHGGVELVVGGRVSEREANEVFAVAGRSSSIDLLAETVVKVKWNERLSWKSDVCWTAMPSLSAYEL
jgi:hypothetical protein